MTTVPRHQWATCLSLFDFKGAAEVFFAATLQEQERWLGDEVEYKITYPSQVKAHPVICDYDPSTASTEDEEELDAVVRAISQRSGILQHPFIDDKRLGCDDFQLRLAQGEPLALCIRAPAWWLLACERSMVYLACWCSGDPFSSVTPATVDATLDSLDAHTQQLFARCIPLENEALKVASTKSWVTCLPWVEYDKPVPPYNPQMPDDGDDLLESLPPLREVTPSWMFATTFDGRAEGGDKEKLDKILPTDWSV